MFWAIGDIRVDAYIVYRRVNLEAGVKSCNGMDQLQYLLIN